MTRMFQGLATRLKEVVSKSAKIWVLIPEALAIPIWVQRENEVTRKPCHLSIARMDLGHETKAYHSHKTCDPDIRLT